MTPLSERVWEGLSHRKQKISSAIEIELRIKLDYFGLKTRKLLKSKKLRRK